MWVAEAAGIAIESASTTSSEIGFCDPWPYGWGLLGQRSFFRYFTVTFRADGFEFELDPLR